MSKEREKYCKIQNTKDKKKMSHEFHFNLLQAILTDVMLYKGLTDLPKY